MLEEILDLSFLDGKRIRIRKDGAGKVAIRYPNGEKQGDLTPKRLLPITRPQAFVRFEDEDGEEVGILRDLNVLDSRSRRDLEEVLDRYYLIPKIEKIYELKEEYRVMRWEVETDRGRRRFEVQNRNSDMTILPPRRVLIKDSDGNRYEIPDYADLDPRSRTLLEGEI